MQHINASPPVADSYQPGGMEMTLQNADLWKTFHAIGTEMIIAKHGRRMFPHCSVNLSGLQPYANYVVMVDMIPVDDFRYKWNRDQWEVAGKAEPQPPCRTYLHPDSPAPGGHWMKQPLSFLKLKLTNNTLDQHGYIILHSMHRYYPRFHVIQADSPYSVHWGHVQTFSFPESTFTAVTAYQNTKITKLKIDHNPFAKGFREEGTHSHKRCASKRSPSNASKKARLDRKALYCSPPGLQRALYASQSAESKVSLGSPGERSAEECHLSPWAAGQDPPQSLHPEPLEFTGHDYSSEEQLVPVSMASLPYRSLEYNRLPSPFSATEDSDGRRSYESHVPDVATVPGDSATKLTKDTASHQHQHRTTVTQSQTSVPCQEYRAMPPRPAPGLLGHPFYGHGQGLYSGEQGAMGQWGVEAEAGGQYLVHPITAHHPPNPHSHALTAAADHQRSYHHHGNTPTEWSQYPLFSYSCW